MEINLLFCSNPLHLGETLCLDRGIMNKLILVSLLLLSATAQAAHKHKVIKADDSSSSSTVDYSSSSTHDAGFKFEALPGLGVADSNFTFGMMLDGKYGFNVGRFEQVFAGLEAGFLRTSVGSNYPGVSIYANSIPILAVGSFEYTLTRHVKLYGKLGAGVSITTAGASLDSTIYGNASIPSTTKTVFMWKVAPGAVFNDLWIAELPLGTVDGNFYFIPSVGVRL